MLTIRRFCFANSRLLSWGCCIAISRFCSRLPHKWDWYGTSGNVNLWCIVIDLDLNIGSSRTPRLMGTLQASRTMLKQKWGSHMRFMVRRKSILEFRLCLIKRVCDLQGAGAFAAPLVATQFSQLNRWSFHYLVSLGISISNAIILIFVFRFKTQNGNLAVFILRKTHPHHSYHVY